MSHSKYQAGSCNIGGDEQRDRRQLGYASLAVAVVYTLVAAGLALPPEFAAGTGLFVYGGALGLLQARQRFCVAYGMTGQYGFDNGDGTVEDADQRSADRKRALWLSVQASAVGVVGTGLAYALLVAI